MALVPYLRWLGIGAVVAVVLWVLSRRVRSRAVRLWVRCLAVAAAESAHRDSAGASC